MAYIPTEHVTTDEQLVVFRAKCRFHMFYNIKIGEVWVPTDVKNFYA
jgi:hypothetical protein